MQSKFWRPVRKRRPEDHQFTTRPRFQRVAAKEVCIGNKPKGSYLTRFAGFVVLPDRLEANHSKGGRR